MSVWDWLALALVATIMAFVLSAVIYGLGYGVRIIYFVLNELEDRWSMRRHGYRASERRKEEVQAAFREMAARMKEKEEEQS